MCPGKRFHQCLICYFIRQENLEFAVMDLFRTGVTILPSSHSPNGLSFVQHVHNLNFLILHSSDWLIQIVLRSDNFLQASDMIGRRVLMEQKIEIFWVSAQHDSKLYRGALRNYYNCVCRYLEVKCGSKLVTLFFKTD